MNDSTPDIRTRIVHHPYQPPEGFVAPQPGFQGVHRRHPNVAAMREREWKGASGGYTYGLHGTPTTYLLENVWPPGGRQCLLVPRLGRPGDRGADAAALG